MCSHGMSILKERTQLFYRYSLLHFFIIRPRLPILGQSTSQEFMYLEVQSVLSLTMLILVARSKHCLGFAKQYGEDQDHVYKP